MSIKGVVYEGDEVTGIGLMNKPLKNVEVTQPSNPSKPKTYTDSTGSFELNSNDYTSPIELKLNNYSAPFGTKPIYSMTKEDAEFMNYFLYPNKNIEPKKEQIKQDAPKQDAPKQEQIVVAEKSIEEKKTKKLTQKQKNVLFGSLGALGILASVLLITKQK
jgi:hypothetical protein